MEILGAFMVAVRHCQKDATFRYGDPAGEAKREISFQACFLAAIRSDELVFRENFALLRNLLPVDETLFTRERNGQELSVF